MNDSFLEELDLLPKESKKTSQRASQQLDRHVTTRHATSSPLLRFSEQDERDNVMQQKDYFMIAVSSTPDVKIADSRESTSKNSKRQSDQNARKHSVKASEKTDKIVDSKGKPVDVKLKTNNNIQQNVSGESKMKLQETKYSKTPENRDRRGRSGSHKDVIHSANALSSSRENKRSSDSSNNNSSDASSKENSRPSDSSKEAGPQNPTKEKEKLIDKSRKSSFKIQDQDPVVLLNAIKELISTYTKQESTKILHAMQELHINSQATLIKNLLNQTDDLIKEMHPSKESARMRALIEENERLHQELVASRMQNENLQNKLEELEFLKQENATLKLKCNEL